MNLPETSHEAHAKVTKDMLTGHWGKIIDALKVLKLATYEEISRKCGFSDKNMVSRRLKELEGEGIVYKPRTKKHTTTGRNAFQYALTGSDVVIPPLPEKYTKQTVSAADYANAIIAKTTMGKLAQADLFNEFKDTQK